MKQITSSTKPSTNPFATLHYIPSLVLILLLVLLLYTLAHEGGHALLAVLFGGRVITFSANFFNLSAHVGLEGDYSTAQNALISAGGVSLPYLLCMALILGMPKKTNPVLEWFRLLAFMGAVNAMLAWVVIPILAAGGQTIGDDSANFWRYTQFSPWLISGTALLVYLLGWAVYLSRVGGFRGLVERLRNQGIDLSLVASRRSFLALAVVGVAAAATTLGLTWALPDRFLDAPAGYQLAAEVNLSGGTLSEEAVYSFSLDQPASFGIFFSLQKVRGAPVKIWLAGPDGYENAFLVNHSDPKFNSVRAKINPPALSLEPGSYQVRITAPQGPGRITLYTRVD